MKNNILTWFLITLHSIFSVYFLFEMIDFFPQELWLSFATLAYFILSLLGLGTKVMKFIPSGFKNTSILVNVMAAAAWIFLLTSLADGDAKISNFIELGIVLLVFIFYIATCIELKVSALFTPPKWLIEDMIILTALYFMLIETFFQGRITFIENLFLIPLIIIMLMAWGIFLGIGFNQKDKLTNN